MATACGLTWQKLDFSLDLSDSQTFALFTACASSQTRSPDLASEKLPLGGMSRAGGAWGVSQEKLKDQERWKRLAGASSGSIHLCGHLLCPTLIGSLLGRALKKKTGHFLHEVEGKDSHAGTTGGPPMNSKKKDRYATC